MNEKYFIAFVDTENVSCDVIRGIKEIQKKYVNHKSAKVYCYGIEDTKSPNSQAWKEKTEYLAGFNWKKVEGPREKNTVDNRIIQDINSVLRSPNLDCINVWIIATSDGDFLPVIKKIKERKNNSVIGIGSSDPSERLLRACDAYYKYTSNYNWYKLK